MSVVAPTPMKSTRDDYVEFCEFLRKLNGIDLSQYKRAQMERRLRSFYAQRGITDLTKTFATLKADRAQLDELLDRITINVSQLWRNPEQWELLAQLLPGLAQRGQLRAWSAGCSYGAEAYTLATVCKLTCAGARTTIHGTDIDQRMVERARGGWFSSADARSAPERQLQAGFNPADGGWQAKPELKAMTSFESGDLLRIRPKSQSYDLILCRNTVIYFSEPIRDELHARLAEALRPGGCLVIGSTERVTSPGNLGLKIEHPFIYRKT